MSTVQHLGVDIPTTLPGFSPGSHDAVRLPGFTMEGAGPIRIATRRDYAAIADVLYKGDPDVARLLAAIEEAMAGALTAVRDGLSQAGAVAEPGVWVGVMWGPYLGLVETGSPEAVWDRLRSRAEFWAPDLVGDFLRLPVWEDDDGTAKVGEVRCRCRAWPAVPGVTVERDALPTS